jgi:hypothetical protein
MGISTPILITPAGAEPPLDPLAALPDPLVTLLGPLVASPELDEDFDELLPQPVSATAPTAAPQQSSTFRLFAWNTFSLLLVSSV